MAAVFKAIINVDVFQFEIDAGRVPMDIIFINWNEDRIPRRSHIQPPLNANHLVYTGFRNLTHYRSSAPLESN